MREKLKKRRDHNPSKQLGWFPPAGFLFHHHSFFHFMYLQKTKFEVALRTVVRYYFVAFYTVVRRGAPQVERSGVYEYRVHEYSTQLPGKSF